MKHVTCVTVFAREQQIMPREWFAVRNDQTTCLNKWLTGDWVDFTWLSVVRIKEFYYWI